jgi:hypothetical protein
MADSMREYLTFMPDAHPEKEHGYDGSSDPIPYVQVAGR